MKIIIRETNCTRHEDSILKDLGQCDDIVKWIEAISKEEAASRPLDGFIKFDGKVYRIINSGEVVPNIKTIINKLKKGPSQYRMIPNDTMNIEADSFEQELYIDLNERK
jgi:hypothetical protein